jgi:hypothetical protein
MIVLRNVIHGPYVTLLKIRQRITVAPQEFHHGGHIQRVVAGITAEILHGGANTYGTEIYATLGSFHGFSVGASGTYLHARFTDFVDNGIDSSGNQVQAQP